MSKWIIALAVVAAFTFTSFTSAADKEKKQGGGLRGKVTAVDGMKITLSVKKGKDAPAEDKTITVDSTTKFTKGDAGGDLKDVVVGSYISVTQEGDKVTEVKIMTPKKKT